MNRSRPNRRFVAALALAVVAAAVGAIPAAADAEARFRLGLQTLDGDSRYWEEKTLDFTGDADDFEDVVGGIDFLVEINPRASLMFSVDHYEGEEDQEYLDFVDQDGFPIVHTTTIEITPLTAAFVVDLAPRRSPVVPYLGAGGGIYFWRLEESGDFIDFGIDPPEIFRGTFEAEGEAFGFFGVAGIEIPLSPYASFVAEGRWDWVDDDLGDDFEDFGELDLSGRRISGGFAWKF